VLGGDRPPTQSLRRDDQPDQRMGVEEQSHSALLTVIEHLTQLLLGPLEVLDRRHGRTSPLAQS
jgi:hypothetical protein